jgi:hypothetical protein
MHAAWKAPIVGSNAAPYERALAFLGELVGVPPARRTAFGEALQARYPRALTRLQGGEKRAGGLRRGVQRVHARLQRGMRPMNEPTERSAAATIGLASLLIAAGGLLLGLQVDARGGVSGTGFVQLAIGALVALLALFVRARGAGMPRDGAGTYGVVALFLGLAFLVSGVLAPGGPWMFFEVFVLLVFAATRRPSSSAGTRANTGALVLLAFLLLFRLWVTYQGSERHWQLASIDIPILSSLPFEALDSVKRVSLGSFTPQEMSFPPAGLDFPVTMALWSIGFSLCVAGLALLDGALIEHENDRIHALIRTLPGALASLVERLLPEEEWRALGLHGLAERALAKKIEQLVRERLAQQRELETAWRASATLSAPSAASGPALTSGIQQALLDHGRPGQGRETP